MKDPVPSRFLKRNDYPDVFLAVPLLSASHLQHTARLLSTAHSIPNPKSSCRNRASCSDLLPYRLDLPTPPQPHRSPCCFPPALHFCPQHLSQGSNQLTNLIWVFASSSPHRPVLAFLFHIATCPTPSPLPLPYIFFYPEPPYTLFSPLMHGYDLPSSLIGIPL